MSSHKSLATGQAANRRREGFPDDGPGSRPRSMSPLPFVSRVAFACSRWHQGVCPLGDGLGYLCLLPGIHMVGVPDHDGVHATGAGRLTLDAGFEQFQIRLSSNIPPRAEKGEDRTVDACDARVWRLDAEKIFEFGRGVAD